MVARKKMVVVSIQARQNALLLQIESQPGLSMPDRAALKKDAHMLAAALEADRVIVTGDRILKNLTDGSLGLSLEWLLVHQNDTAVERQKVMTRLVDLSRNKPNPLLPV